MRDRIGFVVPAVCDILTGTINSSQRREQFMRTDATKSTVASQLVRSPTSEDDQTPCQL